MVMDLLYLSFLVASSKTLAPTKLYCFALKRVIISKGNRLIMPTRAVRAYLLFLQKETTGLFFLEEETMQGIGKHPAEEYSHTPILRMRGGRASPLFEIP
jgi:hypothetical protein